MTKLILRKGFCALLIAVMLIAFFPAQDAQAATKAYKSIDVIYNVQNAQDDDPHLATAEFPAECQGLYLWSEYNFELDGSSYRLLWCSKNADGSDAVCVADSRNLQTEHVIDEPGYYPPQTFDTRILTNGTWIYFIMCDYIDGSAHLYKVKYNSTEPQWVADLPDTNDGHLIALYNNQIYYESYWQANMTSQTIRSVSLKTGKIYSRRSNADAYFIRNASSRYIMYKNMDLSKGSTLNMTYVYDCKEKTSAKLGYTVSPAISSSKLYYGLSRDSGGYNIYKKGISGRGTKTLVVSLKSAYTIGTINSSYVYWTKKTDNGDYTYYRYSIKNKKSTKISESAYKDYGWMHE